MQLKGFRFFVFCFFLGILNFFEFSTAHAESNVWDVLREHIHLNHQLNQPEVQHQIHWLVSHPSYIQNLSASEPYIYHIVTEVKKRGLPGELALIPMLESAYDPFAYSGVGAAGLWQLMPGTGSELGLKRDWWFDARRSIGPSTDAALNYLAYLNKFFRGDWTLAIAAYDAGEGTIARAIKKNGQALPRVNFWRLPLPLETRLYVPRLLALAELIKYPERYKVRLPHIPHVPYFEEVDIGSQINLTEAARLAGISYRDLIKLNPGFNRWKMAPSQPFKLLIPTKKVAHFKENLAGFSQKSRRAIGQQPPSQVSKAPSSVPFLSTYKVLYIVQKGDNYQSLEKRYEVSQKDLQKWNRLSDKALLNPGQALVIWRKKTEQKTYRVKLGDSLTQIARANHTSIEALRRLNPQISRSLRQGQVLVVA